MIPKEQSGEKFQELVNLMDQLRENCPWDKKQTIKSLQKYTIEELYELVDAINNEDSEEIKEELGDLLFHSIFYARIASETDDFTISDVINDVHEKLVRRHPHIFGDVTVKDDKDVAKNWEQIKLKEGKKSVLSGVPNSLPAITKAYRIQEKTAQVGFDFEKVEDVWAKVNEEKVELEEAIEANDREQIEAELGDLFFALINYARFQEIDPEAVLERTNQKFINRFKYVEEKVTEKDGKWEDSNLEMMDKYWNEAKKSLK